MRQIDLQRGDRDRLVALVVGGALERLDQCFCECAVAPLRPFQRELPAGGRGKHDDSLLGRSERVSELIDIRLGRPLSGMQSAREAGVEKSDNLTGNLGEEILNLKVLDR